MSATCSTVAVTGQARPLREGDRVVVYGKFEFYPARGSLSLRISELHPVGLGELLARLQRIRELFAAEGLTAAERKRPLPFLPKVVGLITGRASAAESDVLANARARWPTVAFRIRNVAVQGTGAVTQIMDALRRTGRRPRCRGDRAGPRRRLGRRPAAVLRRDAVPGGSACRTPVVSASATSRITRSSTTSPTYAAPPRPMRASDRPGRRRRAPARRSAAQPRPPQPDDWVVTEQHRLDRHPGRSVLADPQRPIDLRGDQLAGLRHRSRSMIGRLLDTESAAVARSRAQLLALGPAATLSRGYAVVQASGEVLRDPAQAPAGAALRIRLAAGVLRATSDGARRSDGRVSGHG